MPSRGTPRLLITSVAHSTHPGKSHCDCDGLLVGGNIWANNQLNMQDLCCLASVTASFCRNGSCWEKVYTSRAKASQGEGFRVLAGIGGYSTSTVALLFLGALTVVLATAPRADEEPFSTPAGERPLPWEYDAQEVAAYWAQRWAIWAAALGKLGSCPAHSRGFAIQSVQQSLLLSFLEAVEPASLSCCLRLPYSGFSKLAISLSRLEQHL